MIIPLLVREGGRKDLPSAFLGGGLESPKQFRNFAWGEKKIGPLRLVRRLRRWFSAMALFPKCSFQVLVPNGLVIPGTKIDGELLLETPEDIPRAEKVHLDFTSSAWAGYGSGKNRSVTRRTMFHRRLLINLPEGLLRAGTYRYPFMLDVPVWLPPGFRGSDCAIEHVIEARLDVDWAIDPVAKLTPRIALPTAEGTRRGLTTRSPAGFHDAVVLEITLPTTVLSQDEPLYGQIALRSGHGERFDAVDLTMAGLMTITMGRGDRRRGAGTTIRIPADALRSGEAVPFQFPPNAHLMPTLRSSFIDYDVVLEVSLDIPWASDPSFALPLQVLPRGSAIYGQAGATAVVGSERLRRIAAAMAEKTGLREGHPPAFVEGAAGPVRICIADAPREGHLGIDVDLTYPDVELGIAFRPLNILEGFRESPLLPSDLANRYLLRCKPPDARAPVDAAAIAAFMAAAIADLGPVDDLRFGDHHLGVHFRIPNDELPRMLEIAQVAKAKAEALANAIRRLPFPAPMEGARAAWEATAAEQSAALVPTGPSLHGIVMRARVLGGEERSITFAIRTVWSTAGPSTHVEVDLRGTPLPKGAWTELMRDPPSSRLQPVRAIFADTTPLDTGLGVTFERHGHAVDPHQLFPAVEAFFWWVLEMRGERRADLPYR